jgi:hypothetical protein
VRAIVHRAQAAMVSGRASRRVTNAFLPDRGVSCRSMPAVTRTKALSSPKDTLDQSYVIATAPETPQQWGCFLTGSSPKREDPELLDRSREDTASEQRNVYLRREVNAMFHSQRAHDLNISGFGLRYSAIWILCRGADRSGRRQRLNTRSAPDQRSSR